MVSVNINICSFCKDILMTLDNRVKYHSECKKQKANIAFWKKYNI